MSNLKEEFTNEDNVKLNKGDQVNTMNTGEDEQFSALNGRLRPRKSNTIAIPSSVGRSSRKTENKTGHGKQKRNSSRKASPNKSDDLNKSDSSSEPQLLCPYCDKTFASKLSASKHVRRIHLSTTKRDVPINCLLCNHSEFEPNDIIRHMVDSHPNQYFACLDCYTRLPSTSELAEHKLNVCEKQKPEYRSKLRQKSSAGTKKNRKRSKTDEKNEFLNENKEYMDAHGFNGIVISCELKPSQAHDAADIEDKITTNLILPPSKALGSTGLEKNAVIVLDDIQWNKRIPQNFSFHNTDADQILSRLGVVHRSPRVGESTRRAWFKMVDENSQKFEKCFDTNFYSKVASNVQENLARFLDGSFNFNPDPELNIIKTRKSKNSVVINTAEGFPILLAYDQYSRNLFEGYIPRALAPKHKWKWGNNENGENALVDPHDIKRDNHVNNCIITLVSSLDIWTQLCMRRKFEDVFSTTSSEKTDKHNTISRELKEILESREIPTSSSHIVKYNNQPTVVPRERSDFPSLLGLLPSSPTCEIQPAVLSGEWVRPRCYVCCACGAQTRDSRGLTSHMSTQHPNAQVQHYEIVGEPLLNADIFKHLYVPPNQISNRTRPARGIRDCTKCKKSITLEDLHQHMLDCAGDTPAVRRKCRYRPFGVRRRRPRLPDNTIRKKIRKEIRSRHRQTGHLRQRPKIRSEVGDAETIRKMIADLPAKRHRVVVNSSSKILRPRRKIEKQRTKLRIKRQSSSDLQIRKTRAAKEAGNRSADFKQTQVESANTDEDDKPLKPRCKTDSGKSTQASEVSSNKNPLNKSKKRLQFDKRESLNEQHSVPINVRPISILQQQIRSNTRRININNNGYNIRERGDYQGTERRNRNRRNREDDKSGDERANKDEINDVADAPLKNSIDQLTATDKVEDNSYQNRNLSEEENINRSPREPTNQQQLFENEPADTELDKPPLPVESKTSTNLGEQKCNKLNKSKKRLNDCIAMLRNKLIKPIPKKGSINNKEATDKKESVQNNEITDKKESVQNNETTDKKVSVQNNEITDKKESVQNNETTDKKESVQNNETTDKKESVQNNETTDKKESVQNNETTDKKESVQNNETTDKKESVNDNDITDRNATTQSVQNKEVTDKNDTVQSVQNNEVASKIESVQSAQNIEITDKNEPVESVQNNEITDKDESVESLPKNEKTDTDELIQNNKITTMDESLQNNESIPKNQSFQSDEKVNDEIVDPFPAVIVSRMSKEVNINLTPAKIYSRAVMPPVSEDFPSESYYRKIRSVSESQMPSTSCDEIILAAPHHFARPYSQRRSSYVESDFLTPDTNQSDLVHMRSEDMTSHRPDCEPQLQHPNQVIPWIDAKKMSDIYMENNLLNLRRKSCDSGLIPLSPFQMVSVGNTAVVPALQNLLPLLSVSPRSTYDRKIEAQLCYSQIPTTSKNIRDELSNDNNIHKQAQYTSPNKKQGQNSITRDAYCVSEANKEVSNYCNAPKSPRKIISEQVTRHSPGYIELQRNMLPSETIQQDNSNCRVTMSNSTHTYPLPEAATRVRRDSCKRVRDTSDSDNNSTSHIESAHYRNKIIRRSVDNTNNASDNRRHSLENYTDTRRRSMEYHTYSNVSYDNIDTLMFDQSSELKPIYDTCASPQNSEYRYSEPVFKKTHEDALFEMSLKSSDSFTMSSPSITNEILNRIASVPKIIVTEHNDNMEAVRECYRELAHHNDLNLHSNQANLQYELHKRMIEANNEDLRHSRDLNRTTQADIQSRTSNEFAGERFIRPVQISHHSSSLGSNLPFSGKPVEYEVQSRNEEQYLDVLTIDKIPNKKDFIKKKNSETASKIYQDPLVHVFTIPSSKTLPISNIARTPDESYLYRQNIQRQGEFIREISQQKTKHTYSTIESYENAREEYMTKKHGQHVSARPTHLGSTQHEANEPLDLSGYNEDRTKYADSQPYVANKNNLYDRYDLCNKSLNNVGDSRVKCSTEINQETETSPTTLLNKNTCDATFENKTYERVQSSSLRDCHRGKYDRSSDSVRRTSQTSHSQDIHDGTTAKLTNKIKNPVLSIEKVPREAPGFHNEEENSILNNNQNLIRTAAALPDTAARRLSFDVLHSYSHENEHLLLPSSSPEQTLSSKQIVNSRDVNYHITRPVQSSIVNTTIERFESKKESIYNNKSLPSSRLTTNIIDKSCTTTTTTSVTGVKMISNVDTSNEQLSYCTNLPIQSIEREYQSDKKQCERPESPGSKTKSSEDEIKEPLQKMKSQEANITKPDCSLPPDLVNIIIKTIPENHRQSLLEVLPRFVAKPNLEDSKRSSSIIPTVGNPDDVITVVSNEKNKVDSNAPTVCDTTTSITDNKLTVNTSSYPLSSVLPKKRHSPKPSYMQSAGVQNSKEAHSTISAKIQVQHKENTTTITADTKPKPTSKIMEATKESVHVDLIIDPYTGELTARPENEFTTPESKVIDLTEELAKILPSKDNAPPTSVPEEGQKSVIIKASSDQKSVLRSVRIKAPSERKMISDQQIKCALLNKDNLIIKNVPGMLHDKINIENKNLQEDKLNTPIVHASHILPEINCVKNDTNTDMLEQKRSANQTEKNLESFLTNTFTDEKTHVECLPEATPSVLPHILIQSTTSTKPTSEDNEIASVKDASSTIPEKHSITSSMNISEKIDKPSELLLSDEKNNTNVTTKLFDSIPTSSQDAGKISSPIYKELDRNDVNVNKKSYIDVSSTNLGNEITKPDSSNEILPKNSTSDINEESDDDVSLAVIVRQKQRDRSIVTVADSTLTETRESSSGRNRRRQKKFKNKDWKYVNTEYAKVINASRKTKQVSSNQMNIKESVTADDANQIKLTKTNTRKVSKKAVTEHKMKQSHKNVNKDSKISDLLISDGSEITHLNLSKKGEIQEFVNVAQTFLTPHHDDLDTEMSPHYKQMPIIDTEPEKSLRTEMNWSSSSKIVETTNQQIIDQAKTDLDVVSNKSDLFSLKKFNKSLSKVRSIDKPEWLDSDSHPQCEISTPLRRSSRKKSLYIDNNSQNDDDAVLNEDCWVDHNMPFTKKQLIFSKLLHDEASNANKNINYETEQNTEIKKKDDKKKMKTTKRKQSPNTKTKIKKRKFYAEPKLKDDFDAESLDTALINETNDALKQIPCMDKSDENIGKEASSAEKRKIVNNDTFQSKKTRLNDEFELISETEKFSEKTESDHINIPHISSHPEEMRNEDVLVTQSERSANNETKKRVDYNPEIRATCYNRYSKNSLMKYQPSCSSKALENYDPYDIDLEDMVEVLEPAVEFNKNKINSTPSNGSVNILQEKEVNAPDSKHTNIKLKGHDLVGPESNDNSSDEQESTLQNSDILQNTSDSDSSKSDVPLQRYVEDKEKKALKLLESKISMDTGKKVSNSSEGERNANTSENCDNEKKNVISDNSVLKVGHFAANDEIIIDTKVLKDTMELDTGNKIDLNTTSQDSMSNISVKNNKDEDNNDHIDLLKPMECYSNQSVNQSPKLNKDRKIRRSIPSQNETIVPPKEGDDQKSEKFMENFGFFSERKPRKSNLLASKKISETFHMIANDDDLYFGIKERSSKKTSPNEARKSSDLQDTHTHTAKASKDSTQVKTDQSDNLDQPVVQTSDESEAAIGNCQSSDVDCAAHSLLEKEEVQTLDNNLMCGLKNIDDAKTSESHDLVDQPRESGEQSACDDISQNSPYTLEENINEVTSEGLPKKINKEKIKRPPGYKEKMYPDIEEIDLFEDKFDKIKRKCRSQAAAAKQTLNAAECSTSKSRKKPDKKIKKKGSKKNAMVLTKGAMKVFDGIKISIPTQDLNMPPNISPSRHHNKRKKKRKGSRFKKKRERIDSDSSRYDSESNVTDNVLEKDVYEFKDNDDTELLELRPSTVMDRFRILNKEKIKRKDKETVKEVIKLDNDKQEVKKKIKSRSTKDYRTKYSHQKDSKKAHARNEVNYKIKHPVASCSNTYLNESFMVSKEVDKRHDDEIFKKPSNNDFRYLGRRVDAKEKDIDIGKVDDDEEESDDDKDIGSIPGPSGFVPDSNEDSSFDWSGSSDVDYTYMSDGYGCNCLSDSEDSETEKGCDNIMCLYRKKNAEKNAVMGKIFKNNALRREKNVVKPKEKPVTPNLDQLFDSLLESNKNVTSPQNTIESEKEKEQTKSNSPNKDACSASTSAKEQVPTPEQPETPCSSTSKCTNETTAKASSSTSSTENKDKTTSSNEEVPPGIIDEYVVMTSKSIQIEDSAVVMQDAPRTVCIIIAQKKTDDESDPEVNDFIKLKRSATSSVKSAQVDKLKAKILLDDNDDSLNYMLLDRYGNNIPQPGDLIMMSIKSTQTESKKHKSSKHRGEHVVSPSVEPTIQEIPQNDFLVPKKFVATSTKTTQTEYSKSKSKRSKDKPSKKTHRSESTNHDRGSSSNTDDDVVFHRPNERLTQQSKEESSKDKYSPFRMPEDCPVQESSAGGDAFERHTMDHAGVASQRARRKCTVGKQNVLVEHWSSESETDLVPPRPNSADSLVAGFGRRKKGKRKEGHHSGGKRSNRHGSGRKQEGEGRSSGGGRRPAEEEECVAGGSRGAPQGPKIRARPTHAHYWSSDGEEEAGNQPQHGWIVGDSHKKLVTMLANAKGRKRNHDEHKKNIED